MNESQNKPELELPRVVPIPKVHLEYPIETSSHEATRYGYPAIVLRASCCKTSIDQSSSNSLYPTFSPSKYVGPILDLKLADWYTEKYHDDILAAIRKVVGNRSFRLGVFRLGFNSINEKNPIVVHLLFDTAVDDKESKDLIREFARILSTHKWEDEQIHVDICQSSILRSDNKGKGINLIDRNPNAFNPTSPDCGFRLPGSSIGITSEPQLCGTLACFIDLTIDNVKKKFGLTCGRVLQPQSLQPYSSNNLESIGVTIPSSVDFAKSEDTANTRFSGFNEVVELLEGNMKNRREQNDGTIKLSARTQKNLKINKFHADAYKSIQNLIENFDSNLGTVFKTSDRRASGPNYKGQMDWGIIALTEDAIGIEACQNLYCSGTKAQFIELCKSNSTDITSSQKDEIKHSFDKLRSHDPNLSTLPPIRTTHLTKELLKDEIFFKLPSRTTEARAGRFNAVKEYTCENGTMWEDMCFIPLDATTQISHKGDSGSLLVDTQLRPTFMLWGGWIIHGDRLDTTTATPLKAILEDIGKAVCDGGVEAEISSSN